MLHLVPSGTKSYAMDGSFGLVVCVAVTLAVVTRITLLVNLTSWNKPVGQSLVLVSIPVQ
uniref:Uncharacterized protein n=1 Tax=Arundo donax TaxID=35708 RepID=A0A0A8ZUB6_ARUDO